MLKFVGILYLLASGQRPEAVSAALRKHEESDDPNTNNGVQGVIEFMGTHEELSQGLFGLSDILGPEEATLGRLQKDLQTLDDAATVRRDLSPLDCPADYCLLPGNLPLFVDVNNKNANTIRLTLSESVDGRIHDNAVLGFLIHTIGNGDIKVEVGPGVSDQKEYETFALKCPLQKFDVVEVVFVSPKQLKVTVTTTDQTTGKQVLRATQTFIPPSAFDGYIDVVGGGVDRGPSYLTNVECRVAASTSSTLTQAPTAVRSGTASPTAASIGITPGAVTSSPTLSKDTTQTGHPQSEESAVVPAVIIPSIFILGLIVGVKNKEYISKVIKYIHKAAIRERRTPNQLTPFSSSQTVQATVPVQTRSAVPPARPAAATQPVSAFSYLPKQQSSAPASAASKLDVRSGGKVQDLITKFNKNDGGSKGNRPPR
jgi:hypothetical protein